jgi:hypothetical protein
MLLPDKNCISYLLGELHCMLFLLVKLRLKFFLNISLSLACYLQLIHHKFGQLQLRGKSYALLFKLFDLLSLFLIDDPQGIQSMLVVLL